MSKLTVVDNDKKSLSDFLRETADSWDEQGYQIDSVLIAAHAAGQKTLISNSDMKSKDLLWLSEAASEDVKRRLL